MAAAALPVIIHLLHRRAARPLPFPGIELLLATRQRTARRMKVRQLLLLAARTGMIAAVPLMLARPFLVHESAAAAVGAPEAVAIVLDDSFSTRAAPGGTSWFDRARAAAAAEVRTLRPEDALVLVLAAARPGGPLAPIDEPTFEHSQALDVLDRLEPTVLPGDLTGAVIRAATLLETSPLARRRIVVLTDGSAAGWGETRTSPPSASVAIVSVAGHDSRSNVAVVEASVEAAPSIGPRAYRVRATIANHSGAARSEVPVELRLEGRTVAIGLVELPAWSRVQKVFHHEVEGAGVYGGAVAVAADDDLPLDDVRAFALTVRPAVRVLLVNGDPRTVRYRDELFYLGKALAPSKTERARIDPVTVTVDRLDKQPLDRFDVVVLANVARVPARSVAAIREFVEDGGGLFVTVGPRMDPARASIALGELLPRPVRAVRSVRRVASEGMAPTGGRPVKLERPRLDHPAFAGLGSLAKSGLAAAETTEYLLLEPDPTGASETLLYFDDGAPALVERRFGTGRVALLTTTVDHEWSDICIRPGFLPLMQQLVMHLGRSAPRGDSETTLAGVSRRVALPPGSVEAVVVTAPGGAESRAWAADLGSERVWRFGATHQPGVYRVRYEAETGRELTSDAFAVGIEAGESNLSPLGPERLASLTRDVETAVDDKAAVAPARSHSEPPPGSGLWGVVALLFVALLVSEAVLARKV